MKLLGQQDEAAPTGTHIPTWQHLHCGQSLGTPHLEQPFPQEFRTGMLHAGQGSSPIQPCKPPNANGKAASAFLLTTPALAEKLLSPAISSHPANFSKHPFIKLYKYIHLVNMPLTRSACSVHNLLWSSTKSVTEAIMQF